MQLVNADTDNQKVQANNEKWFNNKMPASRWHCQRKEREVSKFVGWEITGMKATQIQTIIQSDHIVAMFCTNRSLVLTQWPISFCPPVAIFDLFGCATFASCTRQQPL